jgi:hypothetical protein
MIKPLQRAEAIARKNAERVLKVIKSSEKSAVSPPLSQPEKQRLTRAAAFTVTSKEVFIFITLTN